MILPEIVSIGIYNFQKAHPKTTVSKKRKTNMFEIELPIQEGGISFIDSDSSLIGSDIIICAKPGQIRHTKAPFECYYIHMLISDGVLGNILLKLPDYISIENTEYYKELFSDLYNHYSTAVKEDEIILQSLLLKLIYSLNRDANINNKFNKEKAKSINHIIIEKTLTYIKQNLTEDLSLETMAEMLSLSPVYFHNCFQTSVGKTLRDYVEEQRIKKAINLLITTDLTLTQIALECGFSSQSYFSFVFKRRMGTTPRQYVKEVFAKYEN